MKIAIAADWLPTYGGAEHVLTSCVQEWPSAPIFTTVAAPKNIGLLGSSDIRTDSILQKIFQCTKRHELLLPWMPAAIERMNFEGFDVVLSSSHAVGKGIIIPPTAVHVCYCHTPMRYAWEMEDQYLTDFRLKGFLRSLVKKALKKLRRWDLSTAKRVDHFIANSSETQARIRRTYGRESVIISPPVDARFFETPLQQSATSPASYFLALGRLVPYKRFDLLLDLARRLNLRLKIAGTGPDFSRLQGLAGPTVEFLGFVSDADLPALYAGAQALLFPQVEDAGIVPMEAQASGVPVIAYGKGGVLDVVVPGTTGVFAPEQTVVAFTEALRKFRQTTWIREAIREHTKKFHAATFRERMAKEVSLAYERYSLSSRRA